MILFKGSKKINDGQQREKNKFAWFPIRMDAKLGQSNGDIIWWERYMLTESYNSSTQEWNDLSKKRLADLMLQKLER